MPWSSISWRVTTSTARPLVPKGTARPVPVTVMASSNEGSAVWACSAARAGPAAGPSAATSAEIRARASARFALGPAGPGRRGGLETAGAVD